MSSNCRFCSINIKSSALLCRLTVIFHNAILVSLLLSIAIVFAVCYRNAFALPHFLCQDWISFVSQMVDISPTKIDIFRYKAAGWLSFI